jgi:hypothetical protein
MLNFMVRHRLCQYAAGNTVWKYFEKHGTFEKHLGKRTFHSLRNVFIKRVLPEVDENKGKGRFRMSKEDFKIYQKDRITFSRAKGANTISKDEIAARVRRERKRQNEANKSLERN